MSLKKTFLRVTVRTRALLCVALLAVVSTAPGAHATNVPAVEMQSVVKVTPENWREVLLASPKIAIVLTVARSGDALANRWAEQAARHKDVMFAIANASDMGFDPGRSSISVLVPGCGVVYMKGADQALQGDGLDTFIDERLDAAAALAVDVQKLAEATKESRAASIAFYVLVAKGGDPAATVATEARIAKASAQVVRLKLSIQERLQREIDPSFMRSPVSE